MSEHKVIFHIDELNKWGLLLKNVTNLIDAVDNEKVFIEVLANSEAVKFYSTTQNSDPDTKAMEDLNNKGVEFVACNNALKAYHIKKEDIIQFVNIVPAGVLELMIKQNEGYAYIKP